VIALAVTALLQVIGMLLVHDGLLEIASVMVAAALLGNALALITAGDRKMRSENDRTSA
jgi:hypothetical protein